MKVLPFKIPKPENATLIIQEDIETKFYDKLHQHQEIQISLIKEGEGRCIIGDHIGSFSQGDVFVIGENLPHVFKNDPGEGKAHMISLFFLKSTYGKGFFQLPEFKSLDRVFEAAALGVKLKQRSRTIEILEELPMTKGIERFITFMELLNRLEKENLTPLSNPLASKAYKEIEGKRMRDVFDFTLNNYDQPINLNQVAETANMTPHAFCRYFKQRTNKTYFNFLLEIRIGNASKLLSKNTDLSIAEISEASGFNNLTNFNRRFKAMHGITPSIFRKKHMRNDL